MPTNSDLGMKITQNFTRKYNNKITLEPQTTGFFKKSYLEKTEE